MGINCCKDDEYKNKIITSQIETRKYTYKDEVQKYTYKVQKYINDVLKKEIKRINEEEIIKYNNDINMYLIDKYQSSTIVSHAYIDSKCVYILSIFDVMNTCLCITDSIY